jgi:CoA:oxalate CoA-transferase
MTLLQGIRVLDCGLMAQGPLTATALADLGAEVIRVEPSDSADPLRGNEEIFGIDLRRRTDAGELHLGFEPYNRGKRGITLNLKTEKGREILYELAQHCDVFVQNWSRRVAVQLGFDYETIKTHNPQIVYLESNAFGSEGPDRDAPGLDAVGVGFSGLMHLAALEGEEPRYPAGGIGDAAGALMGLVAILAGLTKRERSGAGQHLEVSQVGALLWLETLPVLAATVTGLQMAAPKRERARNPLFNLYRSEDDRWIILGEWQPERRLADFYQIIGRQDLMEDARFNSFQGVMENGAALITILDEAFSKRSAEQWIRDLRAKGILVSAVNSVPEAVRSEQVLANGYVQEYEHPGYGVVAAAALPIKVDGRPLPIAGAAPAWGEHTVEVLTEFCELGMDDIAKLFAEDVL